MYEIQNRTASPYRSIVYIQTEWADGSLTRASGVIVGVNDVLTAGHVVFDAERGGYATRFTIFPAADTSPFSAPFGSFSDVAMVITPVADWDANGDGLLYASESQFDLAVLALRTPIGNTTGWLPVTSAGGDFAGTIDGYPARGTGLMEEQASAVADPQYSVYAVDTSLGAGASGGPMLRNIGGTIAVAGVLSSGTTDLTTATYAGLFGAGNAQWLQNALASDDAAMAGAGSPMATGASGGAAGSVAWFGTNADDTFRSTALNETFLGRGGSDTVRFDGNRASFVLTHAGANVVAQDTQPTRDGQDTLAGITHASFTDMSVNLRIGADSKTIAPGDLKLLQELYVAFFNRIPDADGLDFWIGQVRAGEPLTQIADAFYAAALAYPAQTHYSPGMSNDAFVNLVYRNVLGRPEGADARGLDYWSHAASTRGDLVEGILQSAHTFKGNATWGWVADLLDNKAAVAQHVGVEMGLTWATPQASIDHGMQVAAAITPTDTAAAVALVGVTDPFSTVA